MNSYWEEYIFIFELFYFIVKNEQTNYIRRDNY